MLGGEEHLTGVSLLEMDEVRGPRVLQVRQSRLNSSVAQGQMLMVLSPLWPGGGQFIHNVNVPVGII